MTDKSDRSIVIGTAQVEGEVDLNPYEVAEDSVLVRGE